MEDDTAAGPLAIITFKAGLCELVGDTTPIKVKPLPAPGYFYLYLNEEEELLHLCWRKRSAQFSEPELDLVMFPSDATFTPLQPSSESPDAKKTNGRVFVLKFSSSSQRHFFWLQSSSQHPQGDPSWFSARDLKLGEIVNSLLQGEQVDVSEELRTVPANHNGPDDDDEPMEDVEGTNHDRNRKPSGSGGAGPDATGGDVREEGEQSREGGADGGRAASDNLDANTIVQNFIQSMGGSQGSANQRAPQEKIFTTLADLLTPASTIPWIDSADRDLVDQLLQYLPPALVTLAQEADDLAELNTDHASIEAAEQALTLDQKKDILRRVLRSPQLSQSLASLTVALRDGGLPSISEALNIPVRNGGYMRRGGVPLGGGEAVEAFLDGVKESVEKESKSGDGQDRMDTE